MEDKDLDKIFREAFSEAEEIPTPINWEKIEAGLGKAPQVKSILSMKHKWMIAASITLICLGGYYGSKIITLNNAASFKDEAINTIAKNQSSNTAPIQDNKTLIDNKKYIADLNTSNKAHKISPVDNKHLAIENNANIQLEQNELEILDEKNIVLTNVELNIPKKEELVIIQVSEIDDIKPLIENEEEEETMLANTSTEVKGHKNIITTVLNKLSENLDPTKEQTVRFVADEEGSFAINIINTFAKNRNKKRK